MLTDGSIIPHAKGYSFFGHNFVTQPPLPSLSYMKLITFESTGTGPHYVQELSMYTNIMCVEILLEREGG